MVLIENTEYNRMFDLLIWFCVLTSLTQNFYQKTPKTDTNPNIQEINTILI